MLYLGNDTHLLTSYGLGEPSRQFMYPARAVSGNEFKEWKAPRPCPAPAFVPTSANLDRLRRIFARALALGVDEQEAYICGSLFPCRHTRAVLVCFLMQKREECLTTLENTGKLGPASEAR